VPKLQGIGPAGPLPPPADLAPEQVPLWEMIAAELDVRGSMPSAGRPVDSLLVRVLLDAWHAHSLAAADVRAHGVLVEGRFGLTVNPALRVQRDAAATILRLSSELGLSPASRTRLGLMQIAGQSMLVTIAQRVREAQRR